MHRHRVPQRVWRDSLGQPGGLYVRLELALQSGNRHVTVLCAGEQMLLHMVLGQIVRQEFCRHGLEVEQSLLVALANNPQGSVLQVNLISPNACRFADPQSASVAEMKTAYQTFIHSRS